MGGYAFIDVSQKQTFIFKHNGLKKNLYNSFVIKALTEKMKELEDNQDDFSLSWFLTGNYSNRHEFVYSGGGNSIVRFYNAEDLVPFVREYSREALVRFPDIELYISCVTDEEVEGILKEEEQSNAYKVIHRELHSRADQLKDKRRARFRRWSYGVEEIDETGYPAIAQAKQDKKNDDQKYNRARNHLFGPLEEQLANSKIETTNELQNFKKDSESEGKSYIGVIALDGNKMGDLVSKVRTYDELRLFSEAIDQLYQDAVVNALKTTLISSDEWEDKKVPVTPVVMAGDDVCLIVPAEHAIETAATIIKNIQHQSEAFIESGNLPHIFEDEPYLTACAGVVITKVTYPFFEAVQKAEALCKQAKEALYAVGEPGQAATASFIDWEIVQGQVIPESAYARHVKHNNDREVFRIRPLRIDQEAGIDRGIFSYDAVKGLADNMYDISNSQLEKVKQLAYEGKHAYRFFFDQRGAEDKLACMTKEHLPGSKFDQDGDQPGWDPSNAPIWVSKRDGRTTYTYVLNDAIELRAFTTQKGEEADD
ncbi:hypothetical protein IDH44_17855 [Paenibacillus sp. IB182496]|uniref:Cas10/Cmr2 second palm domain-containing protein n=1 Tax=Paenibacillus sabuli TaxID=2772509 RepID=A0A927GT80_9BACL|nr:hypothetical protein [Paenibacillus sabuli]MBD2847066.1 hypothetical protein [Paenibacillus sabuli]